MLEKKRKEKHREVNFVRKWGFCIFRLRTQGLSSINVHMYALAVIFLFFFSFLNFRLER